MAAFVPVKAIEPASRWPSLKFTLLRINEYLSDRAASFGKQLGESNAGRAGGDRGEWAAIFGRCFGLGVEEIEMARAAAQPDEQDRFGFRGLGRRQRSLAGRRQCKRGGEASTQKRPAQSPPDRFHKENCRCRSSPGTPV